MYKLMALYKGQKGLLISAALALMLAAGWVSLLHPLQSIAVLATADRVLTVQTDVEPKLILLATNEMVLSAEGGQTRVTATVRNAAGQAVAGVEVRFSSDKGAVSPEIVTTDASRVAAATFTAHGQGGLAVIQAMAAELVQNTRVQIQKSGSAAAVNTLTISRNPQQVTPGQQVPIAVTLRDPSGAPIQDELVTFFGSVGKILPISGVTDESGQVAATYVAGNIEGHATITALAGYVAESVKLTIIDTTASPTVMPSATPQPTPIGTPPLPTAPTAQTPPPKLFLPLIQREQSR